MKTLAEKNKIGIFNNTTVWEYVLKHESGIEIRLLSFGATVKSIETPDKNGKSGHILLGFDSWESYIDNSLYTGATVAPVAGRIAGALLPLDGTTVPVSKNDRNNCLHGGFDSPSFMNWHETACDDQSVTLSVRLPDGHDGFPGNRTFTACFSLDDAGEFAIDFSADTDALTYLNMTNHNYFNLDGDFSRDALGMVAEINADRCTENNEEDLGVALMQVEGTPFDFRNPISFAENRDRYPGDRQLEIARGFDHSFEVKGSGMRRMIRLTGPTSGRTLELFCDKPALVVYSGGYIDDSFVLHGGVRACPFCAVALEPQYFPNAPYIDGVDYVLTAPGEKHENHIRYRFGVNG